MNSGTSLAGKRVLVTGAAGFIGGHLCEALRQSGAEVHALSRRPEAPHFLAGCAHHATDLVDTTAVRGLLSRIRPVVTYHLAGFVSGRRGLDLVSPTLRDNVVAGVGLLEMLCRERCGRVVLVGSSDEPDVGEVAVSPYAASKAALHVYGGMFHASFHLPVVSVRVFMAYGPRQQESKLVPYVVTSLLRDKAARLTGSKRVCDFVFVADVVDGLMRAGERPGLEGQTIDLGSGVATAVADVAELIRELVGASAGRIVEYPEELETVPAKVADTEEAARLLGWRACRDLRQGLSETISWYKYNVHGNSG